MKEKKITHYVMAADTYGVKYVVCDENVDACLSMSIGNDKVGKKVWCLNFPIYYTCDHRCECYKEHKCYAQGGCYNYGSNQLKYTQNFKFIQEHTIEEIAAEILKIMATDISIKKFRYFTCGDFTQKILEAAVIVAKTREDVEFWAYTKKYAIVNHYVKTHGNSITAAIPSNLAIVFSHWMNEDGTYFPMENPYNFPTSEFIPCGREELAKTVTHICPCSDPSVVATCETCEHPCYRLKEGQSMALLEHSTTATAARDAILRKAHKALKEAAKLAKKGA